MIIETNYVTQEEFKRELQKVAEEGKGVWNLMGRLQVMFGFTTDKEVDKLMDQIIINGIKQEQEEKEKMDF